MKIIKITPIRFSANTEGLVDVTYRQRCGFLWMKKRLVIRRAASSTGVLWSWANSPRTYLFELTDIIKAHVPELCQGEILLNDGVPIKELAIAPANNDRFFDLAKTAQTYVIADKVPENRKHYLTAGKEYKAMPDFNDGYFYIVDDEKTRIYCCFVSCPHLNGADWRRIER